MHWMPLLYMMEIIWSGCGLATLKVKMRKMSPLFYSFQVIWNWTGNYLLILYNSDQKGICNDIILSLFVLKIGLRLKKSSIKFEIVFFVVEQIRLEFEPYQRETFITVIFMFVQISIRENSLLTTPWLLEKARLNQWANVKLTGGQKLCMPNLCFLHNLNLFK